MKNLTGTSWRTWKRNRSKDTHKPCVPLPKPVPPSFVNNSASGTITKKNAPDASNHHETSSNIMLPNSSPLWLGTKLMDTVCRVLKGFAGELYALGDLRKQRQTLHSCVFEEPLADKEAPLSSPTFPKKQVGGILPTILDFPPRILFKRIRASQLMTCLEVQVPCLKGDLFRYSRTRFIGCIFRRRTKFSTVNLPR